MAKIKLNSIWEKWAKNQKTQMTLIRTEEEFYEFLFSPSTEVTDLIFRTRMWRGYPGNTRRIT
jgi:hypothetical protein